MPFGGMWGGHIMHEASLTTALQRSATVSFPAFCHQAERTTPPPPVSVQKLNSAAKIFAQTM